MVEVKYSGLWDDVLESIDAITLVKQDLEEREKYLQKEFDELTDKLTDYLDFRPKHQAVMINNFEDTDMIVSISSTLFGLETVEKVKEWMNKFQLSDFRVDGEWTRIIFKVK